MAVWAPFLKPTAGRQQPAGQSRVSISHFLKTRPDLTLSLVQRHLTRRKDTGFVAALRSFSFRIATIGRVAEAVWAVVR
jgi:predicted small integral membrane protein